jgi:hypothetical protein
MSSIKLKCLDDLGNDIFIVDSNTGILSTNTTESLNSTVGAVRLSGGLSIHQTKNATSITSGGALTIAGGASFSKDVHIGGDLVVYGTQTQIISQIVKIQDNLLVVNSLPNSSRDGGILFQRYQLENDSNTGDIVQDIPTLNFTLVNATTNTITLPLSSSSIDDYYNNWFIRIDSGPGQDQIRQITSYIGITRTASLSSSFTTIPESNDNISMFNKIYASYFYRESSDNFVLGWTTNDPNSSNIDIADYIGLSCGYVHINDTTNAIGLGSGGSFNTIGGASILKNLYVGDNSVFSSNVTISNSLSSDFITTQNQYINHHLTIGNTVLTSNVIATNFTSSSAFVTNISSNSLLSSNISTSNIITTNTSIQNLLATDSTISNTNITSLTSLEANITNTTIANLYTSKICSLGNSNTIGNIFTTGGNVGINIENPDYHLDVNGNVHVNADLYVDGIITGGVGTSSTFAYLTLTSTDESINLSTGSLLTYGGITIQSQTNSESVTNGGSFLTEGGASIGKRLFIGDGLISLSNANTIGNIFTTGGNTGFNTTTPLSTLDVYGYSYIGHSTPTDVMSYDQITLTPLNEDVGIVELNLNTDNGKRNWVYADSTSGMRLGGYGSVSIQPNDTTIATFTTSGEMVLSSTSGNDLSITVNNLSSLQTNNLLPIVLNPYGGNVGIGSTSANYKLHIYGTQYIQSTQFVGNTNITDISGGALNVLGDIIVSGTTGIYFTNHGVNSPSFTSRSPGSKIILSSQLSNTSGDYAIGIETSNMWFSVPELSNGIKWYAGTTNTMSLEPYGCLSINGTANSDGIGTGGSFTVLGGGSISKDLHIGGSLYINGQNASIISGRTTIGNYNGTGSLTLSNISIGTTMGNTNYKIIGNLNTITNNTNIYTVTFTSLTLTTFNVNIYRIDSLGSGWSDNNLCLSWEIIP